MPGCPKPTGNVRKSVQTIAIQARSLRPPNAVLQKKFGNHGIFSIQVGQYVEEPAFRQISREPRRRVRIDERLEWIVGYCLFPRFSVKRAAETSRGIRVVQLRAVKPVRQRRLSNPGMFRTDVVWRKVEKNLHALLV